MCMDNVKKPQKMSEIRISCRSRIDITGVDEILGYDDRSIVLSVCGTRTVVEGEDLRVTVLSVDEGRISACGKVNAVICEDDLPLRKGLFGRIRKG